MPKIKGGTSCAVAACRNSFYLTKEGEDYIGYHRFPKDKKLRRLWVERCMRCDSFNADTSFVCSVHFYSNDFERHLMSEFGLSKKRDVLKKNAIPSLKLSLNDRSLDTVHDIKRIKREPGLTPDIMSGGCVCSVAVCKNRWASTRGREDIVSYYIFPKDPELKSIWIQSCQRAGAWNPSTSRVCSDHFAPHQFEDDIEARIMGLKRTKKLKPGAFPTLKLSLSDDELTSCIGEKMPRTRRKYNKTKTSVPRNITENKTMTIGSSNKESGNVKLSLSIKSEDESEIYSSEPDARIFEAVELKPTLTRKRKLRDAFDGGSNCTESSSNRAANSQNCYLVEENKRLKVEIASLKAKFDECLKKLKTSKKNNAALETALMKCLTLKAAPP